MNFTDTSNNNPTNWLWSLGDGKFSGQKNPVHKYDRLGTYIVILTEGIMEALTLRLLKIYNCQQQ